MGTASARLSAAGDSLAFVHPGMLHLQSDIDRMQSMQLAKQEPWLSGWNRLIANSHASAAYSPRPVDTVYRGTGTPENYSRLYNDAAAAYALALRWRIASGPSEMAGAHSDADTLYRDAALRILNAWSSTLKKIDGTTDKFLAAGIYGYQLANAAELMRGNDHWADADFARFRNMMDTVFYPMNHDFLADHHGACISHYWANWDLVNMASMISIGILNDNRAIYGEAVEYFKHGAGNGSVQNVVWYLHPGGLGQWQESGRDQGHALLGPAVLGAFLEMAWHQSDDLYGYDDNRILKGFEYVAKYNLGDSVPYRTYDNCDKVNQTAISPDSRGGMRPGWELIYNHYVNRKGIPAPYSQRYAELVRPEGGGGDYGPNSGGYDQLGYGTLTATLKPAGTALQWKVGNPKPGKKADASRRESASLPPLFLSNTEGRLVPMHAPRATPVFAIPPPPR
ncbi:MAG: cell wall anchor protein [Fibrobacteria bacterium]